MQSHINNDLHLCFEAVLLQYQNLRNKLLFLHGQTDSFVDSITFKIYLLLYLNDVEEEEQQTSR